MNPLKKSVALLLLGLFVLFAAYHSYKPLPEGLAYSGRSLPAQDVTFLGDNAWIDEAGNRQLDQDIFDSVFDLIGDAQELIVLDMFLFNDFQGPQPETHRLLSSELTSALIAQKKSYPDLQIVVITDPLNTIYGGLESEYFQSLRAAGIDVVMTNLPPLRDSNPTYSWFWRLFIRPFGNDTGGFLPNPLGQGKVTARSYLELANFKANHRKTIFADTPSGYAGIVTSANPHDGSSAHRNTAIRFTGAAAIDLLKTENAVLDLSGHPTIALPTPTRQDKAEAYVQVVTERAIKTSVLKHINAAGPGDQLDLMMFYLSEYEIIDALASAKERGAEIRVLLDPNKDAFGHKKDGVPNRPVAAMLHDHGVRMRWANVKGEQSHTKMLLATLEEGTSVMITGSANYTRRNLNNFNLETNVVVTGPAEAEVFTAARTYFDATWNNKDGRGYSLPYKAYADDSMYLQIKAGFMEGTGLSTF